MVRVGRNAVNRDSDPRRRPLCGGNKVCGSTLVVLLSSTRKLQLAIESAIPRYALHNDQVRYCLEFIRFNPMQPSSRPSADCHEIDAHCPRASLFSNAGPCLSFPAL